MSRETIDEKAARYLAEGRVRVRAVSSNAVEAEVQGSARRSTKPAAKGAAGRVVALLGSVCAATSEPCGW